MTLELQTTDFTDAAPYHDWIHHNPLTFVVTDRPVFPVPRNTLPRRVRQAISAALGDGVPTLSEVARELGLSARTLQRRLSAQGHTFQGIVDTARRQRAQQLLRESDHCLAEIAFLTGFSEQSAFSRAFKRWSGQTPRSYRLAARFG